MKINDKILQIIQSFAITPNAFAQKLGVKSPIIYNILNGRNNPGAELLQKIGSTFDISMDWLLMNRGEMRIKSAPNPAPYAAPNPKNKVNMVKEDQSEYLTTIQLEQKEGDIKYVPMITARAAAGYPSEYVTQTFWNELEQYPVPAREFRGTYIAIQVTGDSMQPTLKEGDWLFAEEIKDFQDVKEGYVHVIVTNDGVVVKRLIKQKSGKAVAIRSDNRAYPTYILNQSELLQIWRVHALLSRNLSNPNDDIYSRLNEMEIRLLGIEKKLK